MKNNNLKRLRRADLLEMLIEQGKEIERLRDQLYKTESELKDRKIKIKSAGTLAEASLVINKVFEAADTAAKQYLENIELCYKKPTASKTKQKKIVQKKSVAKDEANNNEE